MNLYVVRHGQTDYNVKKLFQGHMDIPLNNVGIEQAKQIAKQFEDIKVDYIFSSPLKRAMQTAEYISRVVGVKIIPEDRLIERSFGNMEGKANRNDCNIEMMLDYDKNYDMENVEPIQKLFKRIFDYLKELTYKFKDKNIVIVTHGGVSQPIECFFHGMPKERNITGFEKMTLKNCEVREYKYVNLDKGER